MSPARKKKPAAKKRASSKAGAKKKKSASKKKTSKKKTSKKKKAKKKKAVEPAPAKRAARSLTILRMQEADPGMRRLSGGLLGRADFTVSPCMQCDSRCCGLRAFLSVPEAVRIAFTLGVPLEYFLVISIEEPDVIILDERWGKALNMDGGRGQLTFLRDEETGVCRHVMRPGERTSHCGIYSLRPGVCRLYPYSFITPDGDELKVGNQGKCPVFWMFNDGMRTRLEADWRLWREDMAVDEQWVDRWNETPREDRSVEALFAWMKDEVAPALGLFPEDMVPIPQRAYGIFRTLEQRRAMADDDA